MRELAGRLTALDFDASESIRIITYFDDLVTGGVKLDGLVGGAAVLAGAVAGAETPGRVLRRAPGGERLSTESPEPEVLVRQGAGWRVWLERSESRHPNDELILERLALAVKQALSRSAPDSPLDVLIDENRTSTDQAAALSRLQLTTDTRVRLIASPAEPSESARTGQRSTLVATASGILRATLDVSGTQVFQHRAGVGTWERADCAATSWRNAAIAFRLTDPHTPLVDATDLGAMLILAQSYDPSSPPGDVLALHRLDARTNDILRTLVEAGSIRAAAAALGMHHSSLNARHQTLTDTLGYDPRSIAGRIRYASAELLRRLTDPRVLEGNIPR